MAGNLVTGPVKPHDRVVRQAVPMIRGTIDQAAGEIERAAAAMLLQKPGALACGAIGGIVEGEAHHRRMRGQPVRRGAEMPGQPIAHASLECRPHDSHFLSACPSLKHSCAGRGKLNASLILTSEPTPLRSIVQAPTLRSPHRDIAASSGKCRRGAARGDIGAQIQRGQFVAERGVALVPRLLLEADQLLFRRSVKIAHGQLRIISRSRAR